MEFFYTSKDIDLDIFIKGTNNSTGKPSSYKIDMKAPDPELVKSRQFQFDKIYLSNNMHSIINKCLVEKEITGIVHVFSPEGKNLLLSGCNPPKNLGNFEEDEYKYRSFEQKLKYFEGKNNIKIAVFLSSALGDILTALRALNLLYNELSKYIADIKIDVFMEDSKNYKQAVSQESIVNNIYQLPITVENFCKYDAYADLDKILNQEKFAHFQKQPMIDLYLENFSLNKTYIPDEKKRPLIKLNKKVVDELDSTFKDLKTAGKKLLLFHPLSSGALRSIPDKKIPDILDKIINNSDYLVCSVCNLDYNNPKLINLTHLSTDFEHYAGIISNMDAIITVDTSIYHIADSFDIPSVVIFTSIAPEYRIKYYPFTEGILFEDNTRISGKHLSIDKDDIDFVSELIESKLDVNLILNKLSELEKKKKEFLNKPELEFATLGKVQNTMIYLVLPVGSFHGWGVCGKYLTRELSALTNVMLITNNISEKSISDPLDYYFLKNKSISPEKIGNLDFPVLHGIAGKNMLPMTPGIRGSFNAGYTFFEENILLPEYIQNARKHFDLVITGCTWCEEVLRNYGLENVKTIIQGIDPQIFNSSNNDKKYFKDKFVIFSGGKFELRKGQDLVIKAFKILQDKYDDVMLVNSWYNMWQFSFNTMHGSPYINFSAMTNDCIADINRILSANGVDLNKVITLPPCPNTAMARIYKNTDIGLFPNRCEGGTNLVLMEYMACAKPVIASYNTGHKDILTPKNSIMLKNMKPANISNGKETIAVWDFPDLDEIVSNLEWAYNNREKLKDIGNQADIDLSKASWQKSAENFYDCLIGRLSPA